MQIVKSLLLLQILIENYVYDNVINFDLGRKCTFACLVILLIINILY